MGRISVELVPRDRASFSRELQLVKERFSCVDTINIPDILKFDMRIPEACDTAAPYFPNIIPHIRAVSVNKEKPFSYKELFLRCNIRCVLVILGDNPEIISKSSCPCTSVELIRKIKQEMPGVKVYAGLDQWRASLKEEMAYVDEKKDAGADGFFTQPFFDLGSMDLYAKELKDTEVFWGLAPVIRKSSKHYWETKNNIVFPGDFECTMEWNKAFARKVLERAGSDNFHVYFCPITVGITDYLEGVL